MFENAEPVIDRILELVAKCPEPLQNKCFEILLNAYIESIKPKAPAADLGARKQNDDKGKGKKDDPPVDLELPDEVRRRFKAFAGRAKTAEPLLATLFDFHNDPFTFDAGLSVPGNSGADKMRNVALLAAAKNYLATGNWTADWKEYRKMCVEQDCYDRANAGKNLNAKKEWFSKATEDGITLAPGGVTAATTLIGTLSKPKVDNGSDQ